MKFLGVDYQFVNEDCSCYQFEGSPKLKEIFKHNLRPFSQPFGISDSKQIISFLNFFLILYNNLLIPNYIIMYS